MSFTMSQKQYAAHCGVDHSRVSRWRTEGRLPGCFEKRGRQFFYDPVKADACVAANVSPTQRRAQGKVSDEDAKKPAAKKFKKKTTTPTKEETIEITTAAGIELVSLAEAQELKANYDAALKKLEYEEKSGELISKETVDADFFAIARRFRDAALNIPDRIGAELVTLTDVHTLTDKLRSEITLTLSELSR